MARLDLPELGPLIELQGEGICKTDGNDPLFCVKKVAMTMKHYGVVLKDRKAIPSCRQLVGFAAFLGEGSHRCSFGLAIHAEVSQQWQWYDFCKTQYASSLECGGVDHFIRCHQRVVALLDLCEELVSCVNNPNVFTAVAIGGLKDAPEPLGYKAEAPILERADLKHLEAGWLETPLSTSSSETSSFSRKHPPRQQVQEPIGVDQAGPSPPGEGQI